MKVASKLMQMQTHVLTNTATRETTTCQENSDMILVLYKFRSFNIGNYMY